MAAVRSRGYEGPDLMALLRRESARNQIADQLCHLPAFHTDATLTQQLSELMDKLAVSESRATGSTTRRR